MDHGKCLKNRGTFASEASGPQKLEKLHLGGNLKFFGYGNLMFIVYVHVRIKIQLEWPCIDFSRPDKNSLGLLFASKYTNFEMLG